MLRDKSEAKTWVHFLGLLKHSNGLVIRLVG